MDPAPLAPPAAPDASASPVPIAEPVETVQQPKPRKWLKAATVILPLLASHGVTGLGTCAIMHYHSAPAGQVLTLSREFKGKPGELIELSAQTVGVKVSWRSLDPGLTITTNLPDLIANKKALAVAIRPGRYRVEAWTAVNGEPSPIVQTVVIVSDEGSPPPAPGPPGPPRPSPPSPPPTPTPPADPLTLKLQAAFAADPSPLAAKRGQLQLLLGLYEAMIDHAADKKIATTKDLLDDMQAVAGKMVGPAVLPEMRRLIAAEIAAELGTHAQAKLDPDIRPKAVGIFRRLAKALGDIK